MKELADALTRGAGLPVVDQTEQKGLYDISLEWTPEDPSRAGGDDTEPGPSFFTAVSDQLGLRLQPQKVPMDLVIVDRIEKAPTAN
jgi:uncharacterized protein (TIGR03435 family)